MKLLKPIKSIDAHVFTKHSFGSKVRGSKFLEGADIKSIIKEGYTKKNKKLKKTISRNDTTGKEFNSILIEIDMGKKIGTSQGYGADYSKLRIIVDYEGNIISSYPIANFSIK